MEGYGQWELTVSNLSEEENCWLSIPKVTVFMFCCVLFGVEGGMVGAWYSPVANSALWHILHLFYRKTFKDFKIWSKLNFVWL